MKLNIQLENSKNFPSKLSGINKTQTQLAEIPASYVVFDVETTGLSPVKNRIIEISALKVENYVIKEEFSTLIKPENVSVPPFIQKLTGITNEIIINAPNTRKALYNFCTFAGNSTLAGHNVKFDLSFLNSSLLREFGGKLSNNYFDSLYFSRLAYKELNSHKLTNIARYLNIDTTGAHRALKDCYMTFYVIEDIRKRKVNMF